MRNVHARFLIANAAEINHNTGSNNSNNNNSNISNNINNNCNINHNNTK